MGTGPHERTVRSMDGTPIGAVTVGSGRPLVLVHGAWNWGEFWLGVAEELVEAHSCWVMDRRARGGSGDGADYAFDREIEDITAVLDAAGPDASLLGHSSGAVYALEVARRTPVERLIVYEPPLRWAEQGDPTDMVGRVRALTDEGQPEDPSMATESLAASLPDVRTSVLDGHGHRAHLTDPELVADEVRAFLAETGA